ncbi:MAG: TonB-dependent receptor, partial [Gammaproteobacteria bacterium]
AGNPNLSPENSWVYEIGVEQPILGDGAVNLTYRHYEIEDVLDVVLVGGFAAPGNIGDGTRDEIAASIALPLSVSGFDLGLLQLDGTWRDSEVTDSVTGEIREISGERPFSGDLTYTRDFPELDSTFGIRATLPWEQTNYRIDQISLREYSGFWRIYWDWQARQDLLLRVQVESPFKRELSRQRTHYDGLRSDNIIEGTDERSSIMDPFVYFRFRWTF